MRLRSALLLLSIVTAAPLLLFTLAAGLYVYQRENSSLLTAALARNRATLDAVDAEMRGAVGVLRALETRPALVRDDYQAFHGEAQAVLLSQPDWQNIVLQLPSGAQLMNARQAWGTQLPATSIESISIKAAVSTRKPAVSNITFAPRLNNEPGFAVRVPVLRDGRVAYLISAVMRPAALQRILANQQLPDGWVSGITGMDGRLIARVPTGSPGTMASKDFLAHIKQADEGWYRGETLEGKDTFTAFSRSRFTGWSIGYAIPAETVVGNALRTATLLAAGVPLSLASAFVIGLWLSRRITRPIIGLAHAAGMIGGPVRPAKVQSSIAELAQLSNVIAQTAESIDERDRQLAQSRQELERQASELRDVDGNRSRFLALLSHELRNPLAPLRNGLALLKMNVDPARRAATMAIMERQVIQMARLIDDLLDVGRIDRGQLTLQFAAVGLNVILRAAIETVQPAALAKRLDLRVVLPAQDTWVQGDAVRLEQIVINLLSNACRYTQAGGRIELRMSTNDTTATIAVSDNGRGFEPSQASRLFQMFTRLPGAADDDPSGLGIGLSVSQALVQLHHGTIMAASDGPGLGAVFTVTLPLGEVPVASWELPPPVAVRNSRNRVLVADDNVDSAETVADLLRMLDFEVAVAHDGQHALDLAGSFRPAVAFLDLGMPRLGGIEVGKRMREMAGLEQVLLVAVSGLGQAADLEATQAAGFDVHLIKPAAVADITALAGMSRQQACDWLLTRESLTRGSAA
jgi:signal transduction histidine kinase/ActR/RegA family two-component response regulator